MSQIYLLVYSPVYPLIQRKGSKVYNPLPPNGQEDLHLWKHYLPAMLKGGKNQMNWIANDGYAWWHTKGLVYWCSYLRHSDLSDRFHLIVQVQVWQLNVSVSL